MKSANCAIGEHGKCRFSSIYCTCYCHRSRKDAPDEAVDSLDRVVGVLHGGGVLPSPTGGADVGEVAAGAVPQQADDRLLALAIEYHKSPDGENEYGCNGATCPGVQRLYKLLIRAAGAGAVVRPSPELPHEQVQLLAWAVTNCHTLARRALASSTSVWDREKWEHVLRICEKAGARSQGVLRAALPTEITEGASPAGAPRSPEPKDR